METQLIRILPACLTEPLPEGWSSLSSDYYIEVMPDVDQAEAMQSAAGPTARLWWREGGHATDLFNEALTAQIVQDVIEPTVVAFRAGEVPVLLEGDRGAVVEVVPEVRVERDAAFVVDGKPAALHIPNAPILGT